MGTKTEDHFNFKVLVTQPYESFLFSVNEYVYLGIHFRCWDLARVSNLADQQLLLCGHVQETEGPISSESVSFLSSDTETRGQKKKYKCLDEKHHLTMKPEKTQALPGNARVQDILSVFFLTLSPTPPMMSLRAFSLPDVSTAWTRTSALLGGLLEMLGAHHIRVHTNRICIFTQVI